VGKFGVTKHHFSAIGIEASAYVIAVITMACIESSTGKPGIESVVKIKGHPDLETVTVPLTCLMK
jgi:hypothetical protein